VSKVLISSNFMSERGIPLITQKPNLPMLTAEDYMKWYNIYKVNPDGSVESIPWNNEILRDGWRDHCITPDAFHRLAKSLGLGYDHKTMATVCERFVIDHLDWDWTKLSVYMPNVKDSYNMDKYEM
jgi:hypothetical protein